MLVSLYTSRIVLQELGIDDYGVYTVIGGVVSMFAFINGSMTTSTQRYLNFELGKGLSERLNNVFKTSLTIHAFIAVIVIILAETIGLWFVNNKLIIPSESIFGANIVYQASILSFCITIFQVPFNATIIAHEKMSIYAYISIIEAVLKLGIAFSLLLVTKYKLAVYGVLILFVHLIVALIYIGYSVRKYSECKIGLLYHKPLFKEMSGFAGWNLCGSIAWVIRLQGLGIILNMFYGPVLNAAKGISDQVSGAVNQLNNNFQIALNPQITKNYAQNRLAEMQTLTYRGIKFSSLLLLLMIVPIWVNINTILHFWLTEVPEYTQIFVILILCDTFCGNLFGSPLMASLAATGNIRNYQLTVSIVLLLILPISYIMLKLGYVPESVFYANIILNLIAGLTRFYFCKRQLNYQYKSFFQIVIFPVVSVGILSIISMLLIKRYLLDTSNICDIFLSLILSIVIPAVSGWFIAFNQIERKAIVDLIRSKIKL